MVLCLIPLGCWSTGNPGTIFDPANPGGGNGGNPPPPPREPGTPAAPVAGGLSVSGRPSLQAMAPPSGMTGVDIQAAIALWFSETVQTPTVNSQNLLLRPSGLGGVVGAQIPYSTTWLAGDRCVLLLPSVPLTPNTLYELAANDEILDLDGGRLVVSATGVLGTFKTSSQAVGLAPRVLGSFPPRDALNQPNDYAALLVFSKPMDFTGISAAVELRNLDDNVLAAYDMTAAEESRLAGNRAFLFPHTDDEADLGAAVRIRVDTSLTDADFFPHPLANPYSATWSTLAFSRPAAVVPVDEDPLDPFLPAVSGQNFSDFQVDVFLGPSSLASDSVILKAQDASDTTFVQNTGKAGAGSPRFHMDLSASTSIGPVFGSSAKIVLSSFVARGNLRSTYQVARDDLGEPIELVVDSIAPTLLSFGPPTGQFGSQFVSDLPELRPYGRATEPVARVRVRYPALGPALERDAFAPPSNGFFIGPSFDTGLVGGGPFPFDVLLTDAYGNVSSTALPASAAFRGFVGPVPLVSGSFRVAVHDQSTLFPIPNAQVFVEDFGGGAEDSGLTGSDGAITFSGRIGAQTVTIIAEDRQAITLFGVASTEVSVPMPASEEAVANVAPTIDGATTGVTTISSNLLVEESSLEDPDLQQGVDLETFFGVGVLARLQRLGWYAGFHDVEDFPAADRYFRFFAQDPAILLEPSTGGSIISPLLILQESTNTILTTTDYQYPMTVAVGPGFDPPVDAASALALARVPGLDGLAAVGIGEVSGASAEAEVELELHAAAVSEGAPASDVILQVTASDDDGDVAFARSTMPLAAAPGATALTLPGIPEATAAWTGGSYPFTRSFSDTLAPGTGYYRMIVQDDQIPPRTWQFWIPATAGASGSLTLPTLKAGPSDPIGDPPLATTPGANWTAFFEAYEMPLGFVEIGFFFSALRRDCTGFARSAPGPALAF
jgi:hypothetical protein